jgi:diguanylate cyclase (GGDEF)-like protein
MPFTTIDLRHGGCDRDRAILIREFYSNNSTGELGTPGATVGPNEIRPPSRDFAQKDSSGTAMMAPMPGKHRLLRLVMPFVAVMLFQAFLGGVSLEVLSSVRAYVGGEGLWSKGQKDAIHFISLYSETGDEQFFDRFRKAIAIPLSDRAARYALEQPIPDLGAARDGLLGGGNHPGDVPGIIRLFQYFQHAPYMATAIMHWRATDPFLDQLVSLGDAIHAELSSASGVAVGAPVHNDQIDLIDRRLAPSASAFSESLGEGSRSIKFLLTAANLVTAFSLVFLIVWYTRKMLKQRLLFEVTEREFVARLSWQASHDALTDLVNRREFETRLGHALDKLSYQPGEHSLMYLDLDQFKVVNDTCGHAAGDQLLKQTSALLQETLGAGGLLARLGGDEFGVLMQGCDANSAIEMAERLRFAVQELRFVWNGCAFNISISIGLVHVAEAGAIAQTLRAADMACYMAKEKGRNRVQVYRPSDSELVQRVGEMAWVQRIRNGLDEQRFCLFAQEIRSLGKNEPDGSHVEMLLRLRDEDGKLVQPGSFMAAAERYGLMPLIDRWVVRNAFALLADRLSSSAPFQLSSCAINLSGATFADDDFVEYVRRQFDIYRVPPAMICFEITETSAIADLPSARRFIQALKKLGCRFSLDDFGTGMSSFSYLKHLPVDFIKIDGSFITEMLNSKIDRAMVEMIVYIARVTGKRTVAEFVESDEIIVALGEIGVDYAQGYAIGKPAPFESMYPLLANARQEVA